MKSKENLALIGGFLGIVMCLVPVHFNDFSEHVLTWFFGLDVIFYGGVYTGFHVNNIDSTVGILILFAAIISILTAITNKKKEFKIFRIIWFFMGCIIILSTLINWLYWLEQEPSSLIIHFGIILAVFAGGFLIIAAFIPDNKSLKSEDDISLNPKINLTIEENLTKLGGTLGVLILIIPLLCRDQLSERFLDWFFGLGIIYGYGDDVNISFIVELINIIPGVLILVSSIISLYAIKWRKEKGFISVSRVLYLTGSLILIASFINWFYWLDNIKGVLPIGITLAIFAGSILLIAAYIK